MPSYRDIPLRLFSCTRRQVAQHPAEGHFRVARLEATLGRDLDALLVLRALHTLGEEIRITPKIRNRSERDRVDPVLDHHMARVWKPSNPTRERCDEVA